MHIFRLKETHDAVYDDVGKLTRDKWDSQVTEAIKRRDPDWEYKNGYVTWKGRVYIPNDEQVREAAIEMAHFGHPGIAKTMEQLT